MIIRTMYTIFLFYFLAHVQFSQTEEVLEFKVGMPEFICDKDGGVKDISTDMTTIRFLGKNVPSMQYKFHVNFKRVGKKCANNQRCTLITWRAVRELDNYLQRYPAEQIQNGIVQINNSMLEPGIRYILNVSISDGEKIQEKQLTLEYVDDEMKKTVEKPMASVALLAPSSAYAFNPFIINAECSICSNVSSFNFKWELYDSNDKLLVEFYEKGSELTIPADTFQALNNYIIKCSLVNLDNSQIIANTQDKINVMSKGLVVDIPVKILTTARNQPVRIRAYIRDLDNLEGDIKINWKCEDLTNNEPCLYESDTSELEMDSGFSKSGTYKITLDIAKGEFSESASCLVEVADNAPVMEVEETEYPISPSSGVAIRATIYQLRTHCTLQWTSPNEEGFESIDLNNLPGDIGRVVNVTTKEDIFLQEIEEFSNDTIDRSHDLIIPPNYEEFQGDKKYLFRLIVQCPSADSNDYEALDNDTEIVVQQVVSISDVIITTNSAPIAKKLKVKPIAGVAFVTKFTFSTSKAEDKPGDDPFVYKFGYTLNEKDYITWKLQEITNCETVLPFSKAPLQTYLEVCDSYGSCAQTLGPTVETTLPSAPLPDTYKKEIMQQIATLMTNEEYYRAFSIAASLPELAQEFPEASDLISRKISDEIDKFLSMGSDETKAAEWKPSANNFIKNINLFNSVLQLPDEILNKLIELRNKVSDVAEKYSMRRKLLSFNAGNRIKRANLGTVENIKGYIDLSELIITTSVDLNRVKTEKENLRTHLINYMQTLCSNIYQKPQIIQLEFKTITLSVEKLTKHSFYTFQSIPFARNNAKTAKIKLGQLYENTPTNSCLGKAILKDYLDKSGFLFLATIVNEHENIINESNEILVVLPIDETTTLTPNCIVFDNNKWYADCKTIQITTFIKCSCKRLGYYLVDYRKISTTTTTEKNQINSAPVTITTIGKDTAPPLSSLATTPIPGNVSNESLKIQDGQENKDQYKTISIVVIVASICGLLILGLILRSILQDDDENDEGNETIDFPKYAPLYDEDILNDVHI